MSEQRKELTRVITLQITNIAKWDASGIDWMEENLKPDAEHVAESVKGFLNADDVQLVKVQGFIREVDEDGNV